MYKAEYKYIEEVDWNSESGRENFSFVSNKTNLTAEFRFNGKYDADRKREIEKRAHPKHNSTTGLFGPLDVYLIFAQGLRIGHRERTSSYTLGSTPEKGIHVYGKLEIPFLQSTHILGAGFNLDINTPGKALLENIINLDELDAFVLNGSVPERIKEIPDVRTFLLNATL